MWQTLKPKIPCINFFAKLASVGRWSAGSGGGMGFVRNKVVWSGFTRKHRKHGRLKHSKGWHVALMAYVGVFGVTDMCRWLRSSFEPARNAEFIKSCPKWARSVKFLRAQTKFGRNNVSRSIIRQLGLLRTVEVVRKFARKFKAKSFGAHNKYGQKPLFTKS